MSTLTISSPSPSLVTDRSRLSAAELECLRELVERGLYLQAYARLEPHLPLTRLRDAVSCDIAGRLAANLGDGDLADLLHLRAYRLDRSNPRARYGYARVVLSRKGPLAAWKVMNRLGEPNLSLPGVDADDAAEWCSLYGLITGLLRDFDTAEAWLARAESLAPDNPWVWVERSSVLEHADRYEEGLKAAQRALELRPWYRAGIQSVAQSLTLLNRDDEALELLIEASERLESSVVTHQLLGMLLERQMYPEAARALERFEILSLLAGRDYQQWMASVRSDLAYHSGDLEATIRFARETGSSFFERVAANMQAAPPDASRVQLPVGFVRQHHMTCAPATLATLGRFWEQPVDHLEIAADICYNGTPWHNERDWADKRGWTTRDFRVTWDSARALLDRGIPFTLTTEGPGYAHLQAVIGYDARRGTFLIRDPYARNVGEALAEGLLQSLRSIGPTGMALVPPSQAHLLDGLTLPDSDLYDGYYRVSRALVRHDRASAWTAFETMQAVEAEHTLTIQARRAIASYDEDVAEVLACTQRLEERYPEDANLKLAHVSCLHRLSRREERLELLQMLCRRASLAGIGEETETSGEAGGETAERGVEAAAPSVSGNDSAALSVRFSLAIAAPLFWEQYAQELADDAREHDRAILLLKRSIRRQPTDAGSLFILANILWDRQEFQEAFGLHRFAACLENTNENLSRAYFAAARYLRQTESALEFLRNRFQRLGKQSALPAHTLYAALTELDRQPEAFAVLEQAMQWRPDDGEMLLFASRQRARHNQLTQAQSLLEAARDKAPRLDWLRTQASTAGHANDTAQALACWREVLALAPLALDAHEAVASLLLQTAGPGAVQQHFEAVSARFPHHCALHQQWAKWMRGHDLEHDSDAHERVLLHLIEIDPADAWARREIAHLLGDLNRVEEALVHAEHALVLEPNNTNGYAVFGDLCGESGKWDAARDHYRRAIALSVDNDYALGRFVSACDTPAQKREALHFIRTELQRQTVYGDGLLAFRRYAQGVLSPDETYGALYQTLRERPDLWHAWSAAIEQLIDLDRAPEAEQLALQATSRFPLNPDLWQNLAAARAAQANIAGEQEALRQALQIFPSYAPAARQLAVTFRRMGQWDESRQILEGILARDPQDAETLSGMAYTLWQMGKREDALKITRDLTRLEPGYSWAWEALHDWSQQMGRGTEAEDALRDLTRRRPGEVRSWLMLARALDRPDLLDERLAALDRAIALNPRCYEAYSLKAQLLTEEGRYEDALRACRLPAGQHTPTGLRARAAWVTAEKGDLRDAMTQMRTLLADDPNYLWGWTQLARWSRSQNAPDVYLEAARRMVALDPQDSISHTYLADALKRSGDKNGAKQAFWRAVLVSSDASYAGVTLFEMQMEDGEIAQAQQTIDTLLGRAKEAWTYGLAVRLALHHKDERLAAQYLHALCLLPGDISDDVEEGLERLQAAGYAQTLTHLLSQLIEQPNAQPIVGWFWAKDCVQHNAPNAEAWLDGLCTRGEIGIRALAGWVEALADAKNKEAVNKFVHLHRAVLRQHDHSWGSVAYALTTLRLHEKTVEWTQDWQARTDARAWMLLNRAVSLRNLNRDAESTQVSRHAVSLRSDNSTPKHTLWLASDAALAGETTSAQQSLSRVELAEQPAFYQFLHHLVTALVKVQSAAPAAKAGAFAQARQHVREGMKAFPAFAQNTLMQRVFPQMIRQIARDSKQPLAPAWMGVQCLLILPLRKWKPR